MMMMMMIIIIIIILILTKTVETNYNDITEVLKKITKINKIVRPGFCNSVCNGANFRKTCFAVFQSTTGMDLGNNVYAPLNTIAHKYEERNWSLIFPYLQGQ